MSERRGGGCVGAAVVRAVRTLAATMIDHRAELTQLDQEIGDGDHGENLARGFSAVLSRVADPDAAVAQAATAPAEPGPPGEVLRLVATTLISTVGGASGPLLGTAFLRAATVVGGAAELTPELVAQALTAARDGVTARGKAEAGDKTMVDALGPAAVAATAAAEAGADVPRVLAAAAEAAAAGAQATVELRARRGRASYLGERSIGHIDPGARGVAYLLESLARSAAGPAVA